MHGEPALSAAAERLPYTAPDARRGGRLTLAVQGAFDGLNPFTVKGLTAAQGVSSLTIEPLMRRSLDEPFTLYPLIARAVEMPDDRSHVLFRIDERARFSDGVRVTAADIRFSFELLRDKGRPNYRNAYGKVAAVSLPDEMSIRFDLAGADDRELPLILGLMPILPRHATPAATFDQTSYTALIGSGPYVVAETRRSESLTYRRAPNWWGEALPLNRGLFNFDEVRFDYYRDANSSFEAFKAGLYDVRIETDPTRWATGYDIPAVADGRIRRETLEDRSPVGMSGFVFNTRRPIFADRRVREALAQVFDFEWINANFFGGVYRRTASFFEGSDLAATGEPASPAERALLGRFPVEVRPDILNGTWRPSASDGTGRDRSAIGRVMALLSEAGWMRDGRIVEPGRGRAPSFELLAATREQERIGLALARSLARIGVTARIRQLDPVGYERRRQNFDFDMIVASWPISPSPGNEQHFRWGSASADRPGSFNYPGVRSSAVDGAIDALVAAVTRPDLVTAGRALDRLLLSGSYVIPLYHLREQWIAYRADLRRPAVVPLLGLSLELWWREPSR
jgi:peptide/nickel transport system substrate-binding protein